MRQYKNQLWDNMSFVCVAVIVLYLLYFMTCIMPARGKIRVMALLKMLCLLSVRSILWLYLNMVDRLPDRVTIPLLMMELIVLTGFLICESQWKGMARNVVCILCIAGALVVLTINLHHVQDEYDMRAAADERWNAMMDYCRKNGNNYYVVDVYSSTSYQGASYSEKIYTNVDDSFKNYDFCGGWAAKSPLARQKLEKYHFRDIQSALCGTKTRGQNKAYFVAEIGKSLDWLVQYYEKRGIMIETKCVDRIFTASAEAAFDVYELARK
ncbi:MAG: hypothetical protein K2M91_07235 [Lachnospiraceae bacterium]|nr:hypothetical protein [Lachnospiraceae bacterium]